MVYNPTYEQVLKKYGPIPTPMAVVNADVGDKVQAAGVSGIVTDVRAGIALVDTAEGELRVPLKYLVRL